VAENALAQLRAKTIERISAKDDTQQTQKKIDDICGKLEFIQRERRPLESILWCGDFKDHFVVIVLIVQVDHYKLRKLTFQIHSLRAGNPNSYEGEARVCMTYDNLSKCPDCVVQTEICPGYYCCVGAFLEDITMQYRCGQGYGSLLMTHMLKYLKELRIPRITGKLSCIDEKDKDNCRRRDHFYRKFGFTIEGDKISLDLTGAQKSENTMNANEELSGKR
jgi:hypothetical protein